MRLLFPDRWGREAKNTVLPESFFFFTFRFFHFFLFLHFFTFLHFLHFQIFSLFYIFTIFRFFNFFTFLHFYNFSEVTLVVVFFYYFIGEMLKKFFLGGRVRLVQNPYYSSRLVLFCSKIA